MTALIGYALLLGFLLLPAVSIEIARRFGGFVSCVFLIAGMGIVLRLFDAVIPK